MAKRIFRHPKRIPILKGHRYQPFPVKKLKALANDAAEYKAGYQDDAWIATCEKLVKNSRGLSRTKYPNLIKRIARICEI